MRLHSLVTSFFLGKVGNDYGIKDNYEIIKKVIYYHNKHVNGKLIRKIGKPNESKNFLVTCTFINDFNYLASFDLLQEKSYYETFLNNCLVSIEGQVIYKEIVKKSNK